MQEFSNFRFAENPFYSNLETLVFRKRHDFQLNSKNLRQIHYKILSNNFQFSFRTLVRESLKMTHEKFDSGGNGKDTRTSDFKLQNRSTDNLLATELEFQLADFGL